jgi:hypothetical protein
MSLQCELLTDIGQNIEDSNAHSGTEQIDVQCEILRGNGQNIEVSIVHCDTEQRDSIVCGSDTQWREFRIQQWA